MSAQHTPGSWEVQEPMDHELWIVEAGKEAYEWRVIAGCPWPDERTDISRKQVEANARLIAAAPELLDALKVAREALASAVIAASGGMFDATSVGEHLVITQIDAALEKGGASAQQGSPA